MKQAFQLIDITTWINDVSPLTKPVDAHQTCHFKQVCQEHHISIFRGVNVTILSFRKTSLTI